MAKIYFLCTWLLSLSADCGGMHPQIEIVGGAELKQPFSLPWMAAIVYANSVSSNDGQVCGATIIGPRHALTAAHCADPKKNLPSMPDALAVEAGRHDLSKPAHEENPPHSARNRVLEIHHHPSSDAHDVAVLVLEREYPPEVYASIALNQNTKLGFQTGLKITAVGWGATDKLGEHYPSILQTLDLEVLSHEKCNHWYGAVLEHEFCAGRAGKDTCFGDSGGPTFQRVGGSYLLLGIESWGGDKCAESERPGVRASVAHHYDFIQSVLKNVPAGTPTPPAPSRCHATVSQGGWKKKCPKRCNSNGPV